MGVLVFDAGGRLLRHRMDGIVDVWDYFYRQNEVAYTHKVGDCALSSIANDATTGRLLSVGDVEGTVALMEVCDSLATPQHNEKSAIGAMLERETKQEKNLELRERDLRRARDKAKGETERPRRRRRRRPRPWRSNYGRSTRTSS